jgi:hypothetical protein
MVVVGETVSGLLLIWVSGVRYQVSVADSLPLRCINSGLMYYEQ